MSCSFLFWISFIASVTYRAAANAFELEIAGTILPAISLILKKVSRGIEKLCALKFAADDTNYRESTSSFEN